MIHSRKAKAKEEHFMNTGKKLLPSREKEGQYRNIFDAATDGLIIADLKTGRVVDVNPAACAMHACTREDFIGLLPAAFIHPGNLNEFRNYLKTIRSGEPRYMQAIHLCRDGSTFHAEWHGTVFNHQDHPCLLGVVRDVSLRIQAEQHLHQRIEARTREQSVLLEISHTLASTLELQPNLILDQLRKLIEYTHAGLFGLADSTLIALAIRGTRQLEQVAPFQVRLDGPETLAALFNGHRPIRIADICSDDPAAKFLHSLLNGKAAALLDGIRSWIWVPLAVKGRIIGGVGIAHARRNYFTAHHAALALSMADLSAITMVNAELYQHAQALAAAQERQRLAQNLHDAVNQSLFSAGLIAEVLPRLWVRDPVAAQQSLEDLRRLTRGALAEMRELLAELRPSVLTDSSLGDLLRQLASAFTGRTNIPVSVDIAGEHILSAEIQVALYRICQEALNNIAKHSEATHVDIILHYNVSGTQTPVVNSVEMRLRDNGHGFNPGELTDPGHYGLGMMRERAEAVGAQLTVTSQPGQGTELTLRWPGFPKQETL
jgi:PAS domain S-box-containing protein